MKPVLTVIPKISVHPEQINFYYENHWDPGKPSRSRQAWESNLIINQDGEITEFQKVKHQHLLESDRKANGMVSKTARKKMTRAVEYLLFNTNTKTAHVRTSGRFFKFKIAFITLTLPSAQIHDDREIIGKCLNQFLIEIKRFYHVNNYVWRAEKQKNRNIHFHILVDKFIPYQEIRDRWNRIVNKLGYVDRYRQEQVNWHENGFRIRENLLKTWPIEKQKKAYERGAKIQWNSPNSTDVHAVQKVHNIKSYITKYMTKAPETATDINNPDKEITNQTGRIWGCNREISNPTGARADMDNELQAELEKLEADGDTRIYKDTYFQVFYTNSRNLQAKGCVKLFKLFARYMFETFGNPLQTAIH